MGPRACILEETRWFSGVTLCLGLPGISGPDHPLGSRRAGPRTLPPSGGAASLSNAVGCLNAFIDYCKWAYEPYRLRFVSAGEPFILNKYVFNNLRVFMERKAVRRSGGGGSGAARWLRCAEPSSRRPQRGRHPGPGVVLLWCSDTAALLISLQHPLHEHRESPWFRNSPCAPALPGPPVS